MVDYLFGVGTGLGYPRHVLPAYGFDNTSLFLRASIVTNPSLQVVVVITPVVVAVRLLPDIIVFIYNIGFEIVLVVGIVRRHFDYPASSLDSSDLLP